MSFSYEKYERQQRRVNGSSGRSPLGYWVPLIITVTAATAGLAVWAWNERSKNSEEDDEYEGYEYYDEQVDEHTDTFASGRDHPGSAAGADASMVGSASYGETSHTYSESFEQSSQNGGFVSQMRGAIRRAPSPQKMLEGASKSVSAGMAAIGRGLGSISEEGKGEDFVDHERWSEEADLRERDSTEAVGEVAEAGAALTAAGAAGGAATFGPNSQPRELGQVRGSGRRTIAIVVSSESEGGRQGQYIDEASYHVEHTSLLSHLIGHLSGANVQLLILIYAPHLQTHPLSSTRAKSPMRQSSTDSFADVAEETEADAGAAEGRIISSYTNEDAPALYNALATQAAALVSHPTQIMPFTSPNSHIHMLRHLGPSLVYMQESLCGANGEAVQQIDGWIGQCVVVIGAEGSGLVDTETEDEGQGEKRQRGKRWWMDDSRVGLGKGVEVVESTRLGEDWAKRVETR